MQHTDEHGNPTSGDPAAIEHLDAAVDRFLRFHPDVVEIATTLDAEHPDFPMGQVLLAYLHLSSTDQSDVAVATATVEGLRTLRTNPREDAHAAALLAWSQGRWSDAARTLDDLLVQWPADLLALMMGHQLDFFVGDAANLRDRVARSLHAVDPSHPHSGFATGMLSFGLEESGHYGQAEAAGLDAVDRNADDVWGIHAVVHAYEMTGRVDDGIRFMQARASDWGTGNLFSTHNWWHLCLYLLEAGAADEALRIYDEQIHHAESAPVALELLDASALLWRLLLDGIEIGDRFERLAVAWEDWDTGTPWYSFNDLHAVVAWCGAGRFDRARELVARLERHVAAGGTDWNTETTALVGLPIARGTLAFAEQRYDDAIAELASAHRAAHRFGGSHAQRDLIERTLTDAAVRAPRQQLARALVEERLTKRPDSVYGMQRLAQVLGNTGHPAEARVALDDAAASRRRFAAALAPMPA